MQAPPPTPKNIHWPQGRGFPEGSKRESHLSPRSSPRTGRAKRIRPLLLSFLVFMSIPNVHDPCLRKFDDHHPVPSVPREKIYTRLILQQAFQAVDDAKRSLCYTESRRDARNPLSYWSRVLRLSEKDTRNRKGQENYISTKGNS